MILNSSNVNPTMEPGVHLNKSSMIVPDSATRDYVTPTSMSRNGFKLYGNACMAATRSGTTTVAKFCASHNWTLFNMMIKLSAG